MRRWIWGAAAVFGAALAGAESPRTEIRRIATLLPSHLEIVSALGAERALVGVSDAEKAGEYPGLTRVGGLTPRWEALLAVQPDLVLADSAHERFKGEFDRFRIPVKFYPATHAKTIEDVFEIIRAVGDDLGRSREAGRVIDGMRHRLGAVDAARPLARRPRVLFEIWPRPLQAAGPVSLQGHLLARAGLENIVPDTRNEMPLISAEWVVKSRPDILLHTGLISSEAVAGRPGWAEVPAVKNGRVRIVDADLASRAGPRIIEALEIFRRIAEEVQP